MIYHALQDRDGYLWLATDAGVTRFDGTHFQPFYKENGLSDSDIIHLVKGRNGEIIFLSYNGKLSFFKNGHIYNPTNFPLLQKATFRSPILSGFQAANGDFWLATNSGDIYRVNTKGIDSIGRKPTAVRSPVRFFHEGSSGRIYIDGTYFINKNKTIVKCNFGYTPLADNAFFQNADRPDQVLFLAKEGIVRMRDSAQSLVLPIKNIVNPFKKAYGYLSEDSNGDIWLPTIGDGVYMYPNPSRRPISPPIHYLKEAKISTVVRDHEGNHWFGMLGEGLYMLPANYETAVTYTREDGLKSDRVDAVLTDRQANIWLGMDDATLQIIRPDGVIGTYPINLPEGVNRSYQNVLHLHEDIKGRIWAMLPNYICMISNNNNQFQQILIPNKDQKAQYNFKSWSFVDAAHAYIGHSRGVLQLAPADAPTNAPNGTQKTDKYSIQPTSFATGSRAVYSIFCTLSRQLLMSYLDGVQRLSDNKVTGLAYANKYLAEKVNSIAQLPDSSLVFSVDGYGLLFMKNDRTTQHFSQHNTLLDNVYKQLFVCDSLLWAAGNHGLTRIVYQNHKIQHISTLRTSDGLPSDEINGVFATKNNVYVATAKGFTILQTSRTGQQLAPPQVYIEPLITNPNTPNKITPLYPNSRITLNYEAIAFREPAAVQYEYRLNTQAAWIPTRNTVQTFSELRPTTYQFQVRARHLNSTWSQPCTYIFTVQPFFYQTWWFLLAISGIVAGAVSLLIRWRIERNERRKRERLMSEKKMTELEQQALQSMMNPHFIFNVMNSVQYFLNHNNKEAANKYLTQFARLLRNNLEYSNKPSISLAQELEYLQLYLSLEQLRCGDRLAYVFEIDDDLDTDYIYLPPMLLQPYIENAIWHGIMPATAGGTIRLAASEANDTLYISITDNGVGIDNSRAAKLENPSSHHSIALALTKERLRILAELTNKPYGVSVAQTSAQGGTTVAMQLWIGDV